MVATMPVMLGALFLQVWRRSLTLTLTIVGISITNDPELPVFESLVDPVSIEVKIQDGFCKASILAFLILEFRLDHRHYEY